MKAIKMSWAFNLTSYFRRQSDQRPPGRGLERPAAVRAGPVLAEGQGDGRRAEEAVPRLLEEEEDGQPAADHADGKGRAGPARGPDAGRRAAVPRDGGAAPDPRPRPRGVGHPPPVSAAPAPPRGEPGRGGGGRERAPRRHGDLSDPPDRPTHRTLPAEICVAIDT